MCINHKPMSNLELEPKLDLSEHLINQISSKNNDPSWMKQIRLKAFHIYEKSKLSRFLDFDPNSITYIEQNTKSPSWNDVPEDIKKVYEKLNISDKEKNLFLNGGMAQINAMEIISPVYSKYMKSLRQKGVIFEDLSTALHNHPDIVKNYFGKLMDWEDPVSLLNTMVWSGGSILYVPKGVSIPLPLQMFYFINTSHTGQFERTLIILDEDSSAHFVEGCTAPVYSNGSVHIGVGEIYIGKNASLKISSLQNWSRNIEVIAKKIAIVESGGHITWVDANFGAVKVNKHPSVILKGDNSSADVLSVSHVKSGQVMKTGAKVTHIGKRTKSNIVSKSVCFSGSSETFDGMIHTKKGAKYSLGHMACDVIMVENGSTESHPALKLEEKQSFVSHEATAGQIDDEILFYLATRGLNKDNAIKLIVSGFVDDIVKQLPFELAVGLRKVLAMDFEKEGVG